MGIRKGIRTHSHLKKILWLSWRDIKNPDAGGAEKVAIEVASRFVRDGTKVTIFTSKFKSSKAQEVIRGVKIVRKGNRLTCRFWAFLDYYKVYRNKVDIVIDEINTIPFFTKLYAKERKISLIHQLAKEYWWSQTFFPLSLIGYILEPIYLKLYRNVLTIVPSNSTKKDLINLGFNRIFIVKYGLDHRPLREIPKKDPNLFLFIGRIIKPKGITDAIWAFKVITEKKPKAKLYIVGRGEPKYIQKVKNLIINLQLQKNVIFPNFVKTDKKRELLKKALLVLIPSIREGWCLVPIEANAYGTPAIGYKVAGLIDSIKHQETGILTEPNPDTLATAAIKLANDQKTLTNYAKNGILWSKNFSWDKTYESFSQILQNL